MKKFLSEIHPVDESILDEYIAHWVAYDAPKKTIMTAPGQTEKHWYYVLEGIQKSYYLHEGKQHIIAFTYTPSFSGIPESILTQTPSKYFLETITDSKFLRIRYEKHLQLMEEHRQIETLFRKATEFFLIGMLQRYYELMAYDIETRFKAFAKRSPHLLRVLSQKDIASYLRIDSTNFSKLKNSVRI
ncbi:cyclic nucleotide-binding domain-containing protein [Fulvivirgaceae bacterium BMA12]|uniref:Cyclic nucleotide-binding domain-containing protein n=1 Tax=Agaribacillus aureus TaxID=3051825 RepID=A0ABT8L0M8_9BACT|nr:cyclic nucleotide-binding domain-containing protein [Fulvivirgaceae bacterium BMA12]